MPQFMKICDIYLEHCGCCVENCPCEKKEMYIKIENNLEILNFVKHEGEDCKNKLLKN